MKETLYFIDLADQISEQAKPISMVHMG